MSEIADRSAKHGRSLVGFYITVGIVAALIGLGALIYRPLRLRYAIHLTESSAVKTPGVARTWWSLECTEAACRGNHRAMRAILDAETRSSTPLIPSEYVYRIAASQPGAFLEELRLRDSHAHGVMLSAVLDGARAKLKLVRLAMPRLPFKEVVSEMHRLSDCKDPETCAVIMRSVAFVLERYPDLSAEPIKTPPPKR